MSKQIEVNSDYMADLDHDEQIAMLIVLMRPDGVRRVDVESAGISLKKFTRSLAQLAEKGVIVNPRGAYKLGKMTWNPGILKPLCNPSDENKRVMTEEILFSKKLRTKQLCKLVFFYVNNGTDEVFFYRKRIEAILNIPATTAKWNIKCLKDYGLLDIERKPGTQGMIAKFGKRKGFLSSLF